MYINDHACIVVELHQFKIYIILISSDGLSGECTLADFDT